MSKTILPFVLTKRQVLRSLRGTLASVRQAAIEVSAPQKVKYYGTPQTDRLARLYLASLPAEVFTEMVLHRPSLHDWLRRHRVTNNHTRAQVYAALKAFVLDTMGGVGKTLVEQANQVDWSFSVTHRPPATFPPPGLYTKSAKEIYLAMRSPSVSPNGLASAIQMTQFYRNRAGKKLPAWNQKQLDKAVQLLRTEYLYLKQRDTYHLATQPQPVHPAPAKAQRIGGLNGYNWKGS